MNGAWSGFDIPGGAWSAAALMIGLAVLVARAARRPEGTTPPRRRTLLALRLGSAMTAWLVSVQPTWTTTHEDRREGRLAVLFDASRSGIVRTDGGARRVELARALADRWSRAPRAREPEVATFGAALRPARLADLAGMLEAREDDTRLADALEEATTPGGARETDAQEVGAVMLVSDGADLAGGALEAAVALGVRVHAVALGAGSALRDDAIAEVRADPVGFLRRPMQVEVTLRRLGRAAGPIPVRLMRGDETLREETALVPEDGEATVTLPLTPDRLGRAVYRLVIPGADDDAVPENDERSFLVRTVRDDLRVLLVAGQPSWDERFLRAFLTRDPSTDLISFFILRNTTDMSMAEPEELALIPFPTDELFHEHLGSFDLVIFQNFEYAPYQMASYLPRIRDYVRRGGSFAMVGGPLSFSAAGYAETPIADILPVGVLPGGTPEAAATMTERFRAVVAPGAEHHPVVALLPDLRANAEAWAALAPLEGLNLIEALRPTAQVLLQRPAVAGRAALPVLVSGAAERGRVLALMTDTSWRWGITTAGQQGDASAYERFWDRAIRWLARDPSLEPARLDTDRERYGPAAPVRIEAHLADARYVPLQSRAIEFVIESLDGAPVGQARATTDPEGRASITMEAARSPGGYRVRATPEGETEALAEEVFVVEAGGVELADPRPRPDLLRALAEATSGTFTGDPDDAPALDRLDTTRVRSLGTSTARPFASALAFLALLATFGLEWILRRRWGAR